MSADGLYLPPARSGVAWLLDPDHPHLAERVDAALASTADTPVDPDAFSDDLGVLALLLQERHFGIATGRVAAGPALAAIHAAAERCRRERRATFGDAWGTLVDDLRSLTGDRHVQATGAGPSVIRADDPAAAFPAGEPAVQVSSDDGVLWVRLARLAGSAKDLADLSRFVEEAPAHFRHDRIVVDLRGNTGGDDSFVLAWAAQGVPEAINYPETAREWRIGGFVPNAWNWAAIEESRHGPGGLPPELAKHRHTPGPADVLKDVTWHLPTCRWVPCPGGAGCWCSPTHAPARRGSRAPGSSSTCSAHAWREPRARDASSTGTSPPTCCPTPGPW